MTGCAYTARASGRPVVGATGLTFPPEYEMIRQLASSRAVRSTIVVAAAVIGVVLAACTSATAPVAHDCGVGMGSENISC
jgi:hypothetical protein